MKLFEGKIKHPKQMTEDELRNIVLMFRKIRADSLTQATRSVKRRTSTAATKARLPKTIDLQKLMATLTPEQAALFKAQIEKP